VSEVQQRHGSAPSCPGSGGTTAGIALALGGGGARGIAHIAFLEVFDELGIRPTRIVATSIGAIYGAAFASGFSAAHIRALTEETLNGRFGIIRQLFAARSRPVGRFLRLFPRRSALLSAEAVLEAVLPARMPETFEDVTIPLTVTATDLVSHEGVNISTGDLASAVAASISIPVLFSPVEREGRILLDGGLVNPCPYDLLANGPEASVAIDVSGAVSESAIGPNPTAMEVIVQTSQLLQKAITRERLKFIQPDLYLEVDLDRFAALEFYKPKEILAAAEPIKETFKARLARLIESENLSV